MFKKTALQSILALIHLRATSYMASTGMMLFAADPGDGGKTVQEQIAEAVKEATEGLSAKNAELLQEVKNLRKGKTISPEDMEKLESQIETLQGDLAKANKDLKAANDAAAKATTALEAESGFTKKLLIDNGLLEALSANGVTNPVHQKAAVAMLRGGVEISIDGESRVAKVGDKVLADHVKEWAGTDEGKHFVTADGNGGGGAGGGNGTGNPTKGKVDGNPEERAAYFASKHPELAQ